MGEFNVMKKLHKILPAKRLTLIQNIITMVLLAVIVFMSFGTVFTATVNKDATTVEMFDKIVNGLGGDPVEMPDTVEVSAPYIIKSVGSVVDILKSGMSAVKDAMELSDSAKQVQEEADDLSTPQDAADLQYEVNNLEEQANKTQAKVNSLSESLKSDDFVSLVTLIVIIIQAFGESLLLGIIYVALIGLSLSLPIVAIIRFILALISFFRYLGKPGEGYAKISKSFGAIFVMLPILWLFKIIAPQITFGSGIITMVILCIVVLAINLIASRLKAYTPVQFKYINVLQGASLFGVIGYFLIMLNIDGMGIFDKIWGGIGSFMDKTETGKMLITVAVIVAFVIVLINTCKLIKKIACRLCCMVPAGKVMAHDTAIVGATLALVLIAAPVYLMVGGFELDLGDGMTSFILFAVGAGLIFVSELVMLILKKTLCASATGDDIHAVLTGCPTGEDAEAPAEEAEAENAPVEEQTSTEEAPKEETVAAEETVESVEAVETVEIVAEESEQTDAVVDEGPVNIVIGDVAEQAEAEKTENE